MHGHGILQTCENSFIPTQALSRTKMTAYMLKLHHIPQLKHYIILHSHGPAVLLCSAQSKYALGLVIVMVRIYCDTHTQRFQTGFHTFTNCKLAWKLLCSKDFGRRTIVLYIITCSIPLHITSWIVFCNVLFPAHNFYS